MEILNDKNADITASTIAIYMVIYHRCDKHKRCKVSISTIEKESHCSRSTVCRNLNKLENLEYIQRTSAGNKENEYKILK